MTTGLQPQMVAKATPSVHHSPPWLLLPLLAGLGIDDMVVRNRTTPSGALLVLLVLAWMRGGAGADRYTLWRTDAHHDEPAGHLQLQASLVQCRL